MAARWIGDQRSMWERRVNCSLSRMKSDSDIRVTRLSMICLLSASALVGALVTP
jgi:hypothetical protein